MGPETVLTEILVQCIAKAGLSYQKLNLQAAVNKFYKTRKKSNPLEP